VLLRESWREGNKTCKRKVANLTGLPDEAIDALQQRAFDLLGVPCG
jgi:hypothetical protein